MVQTLVISLYIFFYLKVDELWIESGYGTECRWLSIHDYVKLLGEEKCGTLPFWYALTGCDTILSFCGGGKRLHKTHVQFSRGYPILHEVLVKGLGAIALLYDTFPALYLIIFHLVHVVSQMATFT